MKGLKDLLTSLHIFSSVFFYFFSSIVSVLLTGSFVRFGILFNEFFHLTLFTWLKIWSHGKLLRDNKLFLFVIILAFVSWICMFDCILYSIRNWGWKISEFVTLVLLKSALYCALIFILFWNNFSMWQIVKMEKRL